jgi:hypothetical protein
MQLQAELQLIQVPSVEPTPLFLQTIINSKYGYGLGNQGEAAGFHALVVSGNQEPGADNHT